MVGAHLVEQRARTAVTHIPLSEEVYQLLHLRHVLRSFWARGCAFMPQVADLLNNCGIEMLLLTMQSHLVVHYQLTTLVTHNLAVITFPRMSFCGVKGMCV